MTDDLNRLRAGELTDDEAFAIQRAYHDSVCSDPCEPHTWATAPKMLDAVESIIAARIAGFMSAEIGSTDDARTAALLDRAERAETERDRLARQITDEREAFQRATQHYLDAQAALRAAVTNLADEWGSTGPEWGYRNRYAAEALRSLLAAAPPETEGETR